MGALDSRTVVLGLRVAQASVALIVLGLTAYGTFQNLNSHCRKPY